VALLLLTSAALGQSDQVRQLRQELERADQRYHLQASPSLTLSEQALLQYGGRLRFGFIAADDLNQQTRILRRTEATAFARLKLEQGHEFFGRLNWDYDDFNSGDSFNGRGDEGVDPLADRWWYRFDLREAVAASEGQRLDWNFTFQGGRQYVQWTNGFVLSDELYALRATAEVGDFAFEGLGALTPSSSFVDFDASRPNFDRDTERAFYGGKVAYTGLGDHQPYAYVLHQEDLNDDGTATISGVATRFDYDSTYFGVGSRGQVFAPHLVYQSELVFQAGDSLSNSIDPATGGARPQNHEDIEAWAADLQLAYLFRDQNRSRLEFETIVASGDDDRMFDTGNTLGGNRPGTDDQAFNAFGFSKTGLAFAAPVSNLVSLRLGGSTFPFRDTEAARSLRLGADVLVFGKLESDAPLDEATTNDHYLGVETDFFADWRISSDLAAELRYGVFFPGKAIRADDDPRHFLYTGISYSF
jgi:hypothetical protein